MPHVRLEVILVQVVSVVAIVAAKDKHVVFVDDTRVRVSRAWSGILVNRLDLLPCVGLNAVLVEVVDTIISIVASKDVNAAAMDHGCVPIARRRGLLAAVLIDLTPRVRAEIEAEEVISPVRTIVAAKNVEVVIHCDTRVQRARARWVSFVLQ